MIQIGNYLINISQISFIQKVSANSYTIVMPGGSITNLTKAQIIKLLEIIGFDV